MAQQLIAVLQAGVFALVSWAIVLGGLSITQRLPRVAFILVHYALDLAVFGLAFFLYHRYVHRFSPFATMAIAMVSLFAIEFLFWRFAYQGELWFLNFWDWIVPAFLVASVIYYAGVWSG